jgi:ATP-binding cassette subfamily B multidrug efflux pump
MSDENNTLEPNDGTGQTDEEREILTTTGAEARRTSFGPGGSAGMPAEKTANFGPTVKRLGEILSEERLRLAIIGILTLFSVAVTVLAPRLLGNATDIIVDGLRDQSDGGGIDFGELHGLLLFLAALSAGSFVFAYGQAYMLAGVVQRSMFRLRESVEHKLNRLPLAYVDKQSRGDLLSRVTNDIDNLAQSLQQTVSQILTSLLTLIGVAVMMFLISPLLAMVALITVPASIVLIKMIGGRAGPRFVQQWRHTGAVNGQAEEVFTGHAIVKSFGRHRDVEKRFAEDNDKLYEASFAAQFMSGLIQPAMTFMGNIQYVLIAVIGGLRISSGAISIGDMQAMIQYARSFSEPLTRLASMATTFQSGIASLERVLELLDADEQTADHGDQDVLHVAHEDHRRLDEVGHELSAEARLVQLVVVLAEAGLGLTLTSEALHDGMAAEHLFGLRVEIAGVAPLRHEPGTRLATDVLHQHHRDRHGRQGDHREERRDREHHDRHADQREERCEDLTGGLLEALGQVVDVVGHPAQ